MLQKVLGLIKNSKLLSPKIIAMAENLAAGPALLAEKRPAETEESTDSQRPKKKKKKHEAKLGQSEGFKRKIALRIAYNGEGYYGVQVLQAVLVPDFVKKLNEALPPAIRVMGFIRTTNGFDSKNFCCARTYMYMIPTFAFAPIEKFVTDEYRVTTEIVEHVRKTLKKFQGTHKFHNFTSGVKFEEAKASRYIINFACSDPVVRDDLEFVIMNVKGQSFMLHQIRKMIGLTIAIVRGYCTEDVIDACWGPQRVDVPKAPGLGLVLEELHFDGYNKKFGSDGIHEPIDWSKYQEDVEKFKEEHIISQIVATEKTKRVTFDWMRTLQFHNFDTERPEGPQKPWVPVMKWLKEGESDKTSVFREEPDSQAVASGGQDKTSDSNNQEDTKVTKDNKCQAVESQTPENVESVSVSAHDQVEEVSEGQSQDKLEANLQKAAGT